MRAIITVIGKDRKGIIAGVSTELANAGINILDISQTIMQEYFVMIMLVDMADAIEDFDTIQNRLNKRGNGLGVQIKMREFCILELLENLKILG